MVSHKSTDAAGVADAPNEPYGGNNKRNAGDDVVGVGDDGGTWHLAKVFVSVQIDDKHHQQQPYMQHK
ncbi:unnamed protein product [Ceratitis capitata]|uniref:(Mediterranean fruit fly) hypothetical protein n=1 Tax=Ceratitis capitata TaxID=7213 RepID=A0A811U009_CERCA|nr:unnamed protein product [Ceratitis capitata]